MQNHHLSIGTCSWKYDSWKGVIYPGKKPFNYLTEYSRHYRTVEVDQWFWSLFAGNKVVLPKPSVVQDYAAAIPDDFLFSIKVPNSITLSHHYLKKKNDPLEPNPHFLSVDLMNTFLKSIDPLSKNIGSLNFQFEYLNKQKMRGGLIEFTDLFGVFAEQLPAGQNYCIETRNPNYLSQAYFRFLATQNLSHVFLQGYYMPSIYDVYQKYRELIKDKVVIRLHGPDRKGIEQQTGKEWDKIVAPKDGDIVSLAAMVTDLQSRGVHCFIYVNNHFEGCAPRTIDRIMASLW